ncbi:50S ribosomal protein L31 type B [Polaribacter huanghezhanensis]|nr:50S ribosomal protein L31 type B [Polaribacter huanghezhanensis]
MQPQITYVCYLSLRVRIYQLNSFINKILKDYKSKSKMKKGIHPENYRMVAFKDMSNGDVFLTKSTANTKENLEVDGVEYPLIKLEISRTSHPFYTGKSKLIDAAGRIDKFKNKYAKFKK